MPITRDSQHDLLLIVTTALFVLFASGLAVPGTNTGPGIIVPPA